MNKILFFCLVAGTVFFWNSNYHSNLVDMELSELPEERVILFATSWCSMCKKARRVMEENGISYYEYDIEKSVIGKKEYRKITNSNGVPLIYYKGKHILGFNENKIKNITSKI